MKNKIIEDNNLITSIDKTLADQYQLLGVIVDTVHLMLHDPDKGSEHNLRQQIDIKTHINSELSLFIGQLVEDCAYIADKYKQKDRQSVSNMA